MPAVRSRRPDVASSPRLNFGPTWRDVLPRSETAPETMEGRHCRWSSDFASQRRHARPPLSRLASVDRHRSDQGHLVEVDVREAEGLNNEGCRAVFRQRARHPYLAKAVLTKQPPRDVLGARLLAV